MIRSCSYLKVRWGGMIAALALLWMAAPRAAWGQSAWPSYPNNSTISVTSGGNVGIGTTAPVSPLQIVGTPTLTNVTVGAPGNGVLDLLGYGGSSNGFAALSSNIFFNGSTWNLRNTTNEGWLTAMDSYTGGGNWAVYHAGSGTNPGTLVPFLYIAATGSVGIGTTNPTYKLSVNGTIRTKEVIVDTGWADYVFNPGYRLKPLKEIALYIKAKRRQA